jgi:hypothetical protein
VPGQRLISSGIRIHHSRKTSTTNGGLLALAPRRCWKSSDEEPCGHQELPIVRSAEVSMRPGLAAAEERVLLKTYAGDLMMNQRGLVYAYTSLERLIGQPEHLLH